MYDYIHTRLLKSEPKKWTCKARHGESQSRAGDRAIPHPTPLAIPPTDLAPKK
jgi:hypothetical protein